MGTGTIREEAFNFSRHAPNGFASAADLLMRGDGESTRIVAIDIDAIEEHPRNREVSQAMVDQLAVSISEVGLGQPPLVRKIGPGRYEHISGWHRILAYRKLYAETGDAKWAKINCVVERDVDDERAERLMWDTNLCSKTLTPEERAKAWSFHAETTVKRMRAENPERYAGMPTNEVIAEYLKGLPGESYSPSTIARDKAKAKRAEAKRKAAEAAASEKASRKSVPEANEGPSEAVSEDKATRIPSGQEDAAKDISKARTAPNGPDWSPLDGVEPALDRDSHAAEQARIAHDRVEKLLGRMRRMADDVADLADDVTPAYARSMMRCVKSMRAALAPVLKEARYE